MTAVGEGNFRVKQQLEHGSQLEARSGMRIRPPFGQDTIKNSAQNHEAFGRVVVRGINVPMQW